jgi:hypothetical protein
MVRKQRKGPSVFPPIVMGEGRAAWDAAYGDAHTWGGPVTTTSLTKQADGANVRTSPLGQPCQVCGRTLGIGDVIVRAGETGRRTQWKHKSCAGRTRPLDR